MYTPTLFSSFAFICLLSRGVNGQVSTDVDDLRFYYFPTTGQAVEIIYNDVASLAASNLRASTPLVVVIDGYLSNLTTPASVNVKNAYVNTGNVNVVVLDWGRLSGSGVDLAGLGVINVPLMYTQVLGNVPLIGQRLAGFLNFVSANKQIPFSDIIIAGHSLGAHVAGNTGKAVKNTFGQLLHRIVGLDPAGPLYDLQLDTSKRLDKTDASFVDVYHTNRGGLGILDDIGTVNVYINGGSSQTGCEVQDLLGTFPGYCSHSYSWMFFITSFNTPITACPCGGLLSLACTCKICTVNCNSFSGIILGPNIPESATGTYLVQYGAL